MLRQRLRTRTSPFAAVGWLLVGLVCAALVWYGLMVLLLAFKVSPSVVNSLSGYRDIYDWAAALGPSDISETVRLVAGLTGFVVFLVCGYVAWKELPRPYLTRSEVDLEDDPLGVVTVQPRAVERAAELAALERPEISEATGLHGGDTLTVNVEIARARDVAATLRAVRADVQETLARHGLPALPVSVTLTGFERTTRRDLQ